MSSRVVKIVLVTVMTVMLVLTFIFNYLSTTEAGQSTALFGHSNNSNKPWTQRGNLQDSALTPPGWAFSIWAAIYVYQALLVGYSISCLVRKDADGIPVCCLDGVLPDLTLIFHSLSSVFNIVWVFLADHADSKKDILVPMTIVLMLLTVCLGVAIVFSYRGIRRIRNCREQGLAIGLLLNSMGLYLGWVSVASFLNLDLAIINLAGWSTVNGSLLALCHVAVMCAIYAVLDLLVLNLGYLYTPYITVVYALITSVINNYGAASAASVLSIELILALVAVYIIKIVKCCMHKKCSVEPDDEKAKESKLEEAQSNKEREMA